MPTLLLSPKITDDSLALQEAAEDAGWQVVRLSGWLPPEHLTRENDLAIFTESNFGEIIAGRLGVELVSPPADWLIHLPTDYRRRSIEYQTLGEVRRRRGPLFVKPAVGTTKVFDAAVYPEPARVADGLELPDDLSVLVAEPVRWETEFRCFVLGREVTTYSLCYRNDEMSGYGNEKQPLSTREALDAWAFVRRLLADERISFPRAVALDIGCIADRGWAVVELNPAWASAIFGCDPARILPVLRGACRGRGNESSTRRG